MASDNTVYNPYFREDPGADFVKIVAYRFDLERNFSVWKIWRTNDGRVLPNPGSSFELINDPFETGSLIMLTTFFDPAIAGKSFGGFGLRAPVSPALELTDQTHVEFDLYYPKSAAGKYMRMEIWSTSSGGEGSQGVAGFQGGKKTQVYIRTSDLESLNKIKPDWIGFHNGETWYKKNIIAVAPISSGTWEYLNIDLHTETGTKLDGDRLLLGNIRITQGDPHGKKIPEIVNEKSYSEVEPMRSKYNLSNGYFLVGSTGTEKIESDSLRGYQYEIFTGNNNLKPEIHAKPPEWLFNESPGFKFKFDSSKPEWMMPTDEYKNIRDAGNYKLHGHCLAWMNQSPFWMRQLLPETVNTMQWSSDGLFFSGGSNATGPYLKISKNSARRLYFNHILYELRHFMTTDERYGSTEERGIIPFHSFDVANVEIHESRHSTIINDNPEKWKTALRHVSWLMAMTDSDFADIRCNYIYLLYKYAHIAVPNAQMADRYKSGYNDDNIVPGYMKLDSHDNNGSIDAYITEKPPILVYNDYEMNVWTKAKVASNMIKEINTAWKDDPLYDGRNLIECMGFQGHEVVNPITARQNHHSIILFTELIDEGLLDSICISEMDIRQPDGAPGGEALAPAVLNQKQADTIGYQYALLFKLFEKYRKYVDHVIFWSQYGASWMSSYVPFDHDKMASQAYYAIMDPDKFIQGHSYLDEYFEWEYDKIK